jgi:chromosome partitioning protein
MSRSTLSGSETSKGLGWPRALLRFGRSLGWPGSVSRGTSDALGSVDPPNATSPPPVGFSTTEETAEQDDEGLGAGYRLASPADKATTGVTVTTPRLNSDEVSAVPRETVPPAVESVATASIDEAGIVETTGADASATEMTTGDLEATTPLDLVAPGPVPPDAHEGLIADENQFSDPPTSGDGPIEPSAPDETARPVDDQPSPSDGALAIAAVDMLAEAPPASSTDGQLVTDEAVLARPPGPRRARFDQDEFDAPDSTADDLLRRQGSPPRRSLPRPPAPRVFVVANQKGGVGKTTTAVNLAAALSLGGLDVLVVDLDPQGNASTALGIDHAPGTPGTYEVLIEGAAIADHVVASPEAPQLSVLPATIELAGAEIQLVSIVARENRLRKALRAYLADHPVDYVFLDCPPSLGLITLNGLVAASEILIPIQCEYYALEGVSQLVRTINLIKGELNEGLEVSTVLLTMYDARTRLAAQVADEVRAYFTEQTLPTVIPRSVRISEAPSYGQTVLTYHPDSAGAVSYLEAAQEIARRGAEVASS